MRVQNEDAEQWRPVVGHESSHQVSNLGRVRNLLTGNLMRGGLNGRYLMVKVNDARRYIHQLVLEAFHGPRPDGMVSNHKNLDRFDNRADNLEWITQKQNVMHYRYAGRGHHTDKEVAVADALGTNPYLRH